MSQDSQFWLLSLALRDRDVIQRRYRGNGNTSVEAECYTFHIPFAKFVSVFNHVFRSYSF